MVLLFNVKLTQSESVEMDEIMVVEATTQLHNMLNIYNHYQKIKYKTLNTKH